MTTDTKTIIGPNFVVWCNEVQSLIQLGYEFDETYGPTLMGWKYHAIMNKNPERTAKILKHIQDGAPKIVTRAEVCEVARDAKAAKVVANANNKA